MKFSFILLFGSSLCLAMEPALLQTPRTSKQEHKEKRKQEHAALFEHIQVIVALKSKGINMPIKEGKFAGKTILTAASEHRAFKDILETALQVGADVNTPDGNGNTPLKIAVSKHSRTTFKYLIQKGAIAKDKGLIQEICAPWYDIDTVYRKENKKRATILEALLENKASPNELDKHGNTSLYHLLWAWYPSRRNEKLSDEQLEAFYTQREEMIRILLKAGLNIAHKNNEQRTAVENIKAHPHLEDKRLLEFLETESKKIYASKP